jgi:KDO2-lipid IV(A) lauroyltransferase
MSILLGDMYAIQKRVKNSYVNDFIVKIRKRHNIKLIYKEDAMKKGLSILKKKKILGIVADQDAGRKGIFIDFFNQPASTAVGPAIFHLRTKAPLIVCIGVRKSPGKFDCYFERIPELSSYEISDVAIYALTQFHTDILEKWIRRYPEQWFWTHRRWMTKPQQN